MTDDFWERCAKVGCVVVPVPTYSDYVDGNLHESKYIGLRYAALTFGDCAVGPDYWFMIDEGQSGVEKLFPTPMEALEAYERTLKRSS